MQSPAAAQPYYEPPAQEFLPAAENGAFGGGVSQPEAAPREESRPKLHEDIVGIPYWPGPVRPEPVQETAQVNENYGLDSTSEASWPIAKPARSQEPEPEPAKALQGWTETAEMPPAPGEEDDDARREEVARIVAQMQDGGEDDESASGLGEEASDEGDNDAKRRDVARMVAELRDGVDVEPEEPISNGSWPEAEDNEARRQEVARMVAEMRSGGLEPDESASDEDDAATREDVASMVAQMRAEFDTGDPADEAVEAQETGDDEVVRDEVRRAVEAARAEMASGYKETTDEKGAPESRFSFSDWQNTRLEPSGPPVIVIKDSEGRVELARVYETLSRVNCDENAALLNYTPHSVTIGLNVTAAVPATEAMSEAVRAVFGRACEVDSDGVRVNVQIGKDLKGKDSAA